MKNGFKLYLLVILFSSISFIGFTDSSIYENRVSSTVCEGDTNIIKAGCSVAVGQVVRVTPGIITGVTVDKMQSCYQKYGPSEASFQPGGPSQTPIIDLNDPCNQLASLNPKMDKTKYAFIPYDPKLALTNSRPGIASLATVLEVTSQEATKGVLLNRDYALAATFKNVPYLKTSFAATTNTYDTITKFIYDIWVLTRNLAYLVLLIGSLFLGITIMIGNQSIDKDGKIKLTVERALPRVVVAVILISSSYWVGELILNALLGAGLVQGFASFIASSVFPAGEMGDFGVFLSYSAVILVMGVSAGFVATTGGGLLIPIILAIIAAVWRIFIVNVLIAKNIIDLLIFIVFSPFKIVRGVLPSQNKSEAFKEYGAKLLTFILTGFFLNLILFGSKAVLIYGSMNILYLSAGSSAPGPATAIAEIGGQYSGLLSGVIVYIFSLVAFIYIIGLAKQAEPKAQEIAAEFTNTKKEKKKDD
jgi:hypothetical protein